MQCVESKILKIIMSQERLNHLMVRHIHKDYVDNLYMSEHKFVKSSEHSANVFLEHSHDIHCFILYLQLIHVSIHH